MDLDEIRQETIDLIARIKPKMQEGVFSPDQFRVHFETPYRARTLQKLQAYEKAHKKLFCRACLKKHPTKSFLLCYQLWIEESDNLLDNKPGEWISAQCMNEDCDFDLITPRPQNTGVGDSLNQEQTAKLMEELAKYRQPPPPYGSIKWGNSSDAVDAYRYYQQQSSAAIRQAQMQAQAAAAQAQANPSRAISGYPLSSASTLNDILNGERKKK